MADRTRGSGEDQTYLREVQYRDGSKLDVRSGLHQRFATSVVTLPEFGAALVDWGPDTAVLECGAGTGLFWENRRVPRSVSLTLTDLSPGMVERAVTRAIANGFEQTEGFECDIQDLPFDADSFDAVVANHMLYHVPDPDLAISELARVLRPEGFLLAATNGTGHMQEMNDAIAEVFGRRPDRWAEAFGLDTGEARLREWFGSITWHAFDNDLLVDEPEAAVAYCLSFPPGESASAEQAADLRAAIERRFVDGRLRIRTRSGYFVCSGPRPRSQVG